MNVDVLTALAAGLYRCTLGRAKAVMGCEDGAYTPARLFCVVRIVRNHEELAEAIRTATDKFECFQIDVDVDATVILGALLSSLELELDCAKNQGVRESAGNVNVFGLALDVSALRFQINQEDILSCHTVQ
jgi:hypothetical protein